MRWIVNRALKSIRIIRRVTPGAQGWRWMTSADGQHHASACQRSWVDNSNGLTQQQPRGSSPRRDGSRREDVIRRRARTTWPAHRRSSTGRGGTCPATTPQRPLPGQTIFTAAAATHRTMPSPLQRTSHGRCMNDSCGVSQCRLQRRRVGHDARCRNVCMHGPTRRTYWGYRMKCNQVSVKRATARGARGRTYVEGVVCNGRAKRRAGKEET